MLTGRLLSCCDRALEKGDRDGIPSVQEGEAIPKLFSSWIQLPCRVAMQMSSDMDAVMEEVVNGIDIETLN